MPPLVTHPVVPPLVTAPSDQRDRGGHEAVTHLTARLIFSPFLVLLTSNFSFLSFYLSILNNQACVNRVVSIAYKWNRAVRLSVCPSLRISETTGWIFSSFCMNVRLSYVSVLHNSDSPYLSWNNEIKAFKFDHMARRLKSGHTKRNNEAENILCVVVFMLWRCTDEHLM